VVGYKRSKQHSDFTGSAAYGVCTSHKKYFGEKLSCLSPSMASPATLSWYLPTLQSAWSENRDIVSPEDWYPGENVYAHRKRLEFIAAAIESLRLRNGQNRDDLEVLDVGCGTGVMITLPLASFGYHILGIDLDPESVTAGRKLNPFSNASFAVLEVEELIQNGKVFDAVVCSEVLEHLDQPAQMLRILRKLIKPNGILLITVPNGYGGFEIDQFLWESLHLERIVTPIGRLIGALARRFKRIVFRKPLPSRPSLPSTLSEGCPHVQHFTWSQITNLFATEGLVVVENGKSSLLTGKISNALFGEFGLLIEINRRIADYLPPSLTSGWYFVLTQRDRSGETLQ